MNHDHSSTAGSWDFFTNYGRYAPRIDCLTAADGRPDWPWIITLIVLMTAVIIGYARIFLFWRRGHLAEKTEDRNTKLMDLAYIFLFCSICGYGMSIVMFFWPAYRLLAILLVVLNFFTWRFAYDLSAFSLSFGAKRLQRELTEALQRRNEELEGLVAARTTALEAARATAAQANDLKSQFLAHVSHEIRTPMTAIMGFTDLALEPDVSVSERTDYLQTIGRNGQHLLKIINDVLDLTKIEAGKMTVERVPVDVRRLVAEVIELVRPAAKEQRLTVSSTFLTQTPATVLTDPLRLRQILTNLLGNAIKFTDRGSVSVAVDYDAAARVLRFAVRDTGRGIEARHLPGLFEAFVQGDQATPRKFGGSGLGLAISRQFARLLGGDVVAQSVPREGSVFTLTLDTGDPAGQMLLPAAVNPIVPPRPLSESPSPHADVRRLAGLRLLLAEDALDSQRLMAFVLGRSGATTDLADNGKSALGLARAAVERGEPYDVILLDMHMPELDGYAVTKALRADGYTGPIIALTANAMAADRERCLAAGCDAFASKPVDIDLLLELILRQHALAPRGPQA